MSSSGMGGGGRRNVNVELNLVPFIDLLSTLICFLLITAVWQQLAVLETNASSTTTNDSATPPDEKKVNLNVSLLMDHLMLSEGPTNTKLAHINGEPDYQGMLQLLSQWKEKYPTRSDVVLNTDSQAPYKQLIKLMDTMVEAKFEDVGVNTN